MKGEKERYCVGMDESDKIINIQFEFFASWFNFSRKD